MAFLQHAPIRRQPTPASIMYAQARIRTLEAALRDIEARSFGVSGLTATEINRWFNARARAALEGAKHKE